MSACMNATRFGSITIDGHAYDHDVLLRLSGQVEKRKKKLSKKHFGTSHTLSEEEARHIWQEGAEAVIIGTGQYGRLELSPEARRFFDAQGAECMLAPTPEAIELYNRHGGNVVALFHVTC